MKVSKPLKIILISLISLLITQPAFAGMSLDNKLSSLHFVSIKKNTVAEVHHFKNISGSINDKGTANVVIELSSVETAIPVRNERLRSMLFETGKFPKATISVSLGKTHKFTEPALVSVDAMLSLHGIEKPIKIDVVVVPFNKSLVVSSAKPVVIQAEDFGLGGGIEALRNVAKLDSIASAVPVSFFLVFQPD